MKMVSSGAQSAFETLWLACRIVYIKLYMPLGITAPVTFLNSHLFSMKCLGGGLVHVLGF